MSDDGNTASQEPPRLAEARVLAELRALRKQVTALQQLVLRREAADSTWNRSDRALEHSDQFDQPTLFATFFGRFGIHRGRSRLSLGSSRPVIELCHFLIARAGHPSTREELIELLWPEADPARGPHRLHVAISDLRRVLDVPGTPSLVLLEEDSYLIAVQRVGTDCEMFEQHYQRAKLHLSRGERDAAALAFEAAAQLYAGEFLADHPYLEWAERKRVHFAERQMAILTELCDHAARRRQFGAVEDYARAILAMDSLREQAHRHLMRAQYVCGQRAAAIRQYRTCVDALQRELGVTPSLLTQRLYEAICHDHELPLEVTSE